MPEIKSQPMPGLCALCCHAVLKANHIAVLGGEDGEHALPPGPQHDVLCDMASGEWPVMPVRTDGVVIHRMASVALVAGTAVCVDHVDSALRYAGLLE